MRYSLINLMVIAIGFTHALTPSFEFVTRTKANGLIGQPCFEAIKGWTNDQSTGAWYLEAAYGDACEGIILLHPFKAIIGIVHTPLFSIPGPADYLACCSRIRCAAPFTWSYCSNSDMETSDKGTWVQNSACPTDTNCWVKPNEPYVPGREMKGDYDTTGSINIEQTSLDQAASENTPGDFSGAGVGNVLTGDGQEPAALEDSA